MNRTAAIVGTAVRLPGGITTPEGFWRALEGGRDLITDPAPHLADRAHVLPGGILDAAEFEGFDAAHFGIPDEELALMDPQQRWLAETADEALQDAGIAPRTLRGSRTGVWIGSAGIDQVTINMAPGAGGTLLDVIGSLPSILAARVAFHFDLRGPAITVDTACSSSLVALDQAVTALESGAVDTAVVGGGGIMLTDNGNRAFRASGVLAPGGRCRPFSADAEGFVRAEGAGVVVLRRLEDARADGLRVRAVVRGTGVNADGAGMARGIFQPSTEAQAELLRWVYGRAGIDPADVDYVQAHGTATPEGDGVEARALGAVLGRGRAPDDPLLVGSVKSNLGHTEGAAGLVSVIATALAIEHRRIPPVLHHAPARRGLARMGLEVPTEVRPWPERGHPPTAGVSSFGIGGTNAHAVLQAPPPDTARPTPARPRRRGAARPHVIPVSAGSRRSLTATAGRWAPVVASAADLGAVADTATHRRDHLAERAAVVAADPARAGAALAALAEGRAHPALVGPHTAPERPFAVLVFSGHGAHWPGMGRDLVRTEPVFADALREALAALARHVPAERLWRPGGDVPLSGMDAVQPAVFAFQVASARLWRSWGVRPEAVVGHSLGEAAAAHVAGVLDLDDAARLVAERSRLLAESAPLGGLLAVGLPADRTAAELDREGGGLDLAACNGPDSTVVAGPRPRLAALYARLKEAGVRATLLADDAPAHSSLIADHARRLGRALEGLAPAPGEVALWSTATGERADGTAMGADYWARQLRAPVRLYPAVRALAEGAAERRRTPVLIEVAARPVLAPSLMATLAEAAPDVSGWDGDDPAVVTGTRADGDEAADMARALAEAGTRGLAVARPRAAAPAVALPLRVWDRPRARGDEQAHLGHAVVAASTPGERYEAALILVRELVGAVAGRAATEIGAGESLLDLGLESLDLLRLRARAARLSGTEVAVAPDDTLPDVARTIADAVARRLAAAAPAAAH
jgi:acyl transferase domain-containing protein